MRRIFSLLAIFQLMSLSMSAQTTVTTSINGGLTYVAPPGPGVLVFGVRNNNTDPITITSIANYLPAVHSQTYSLWYNPTTVAGLPGAISTANGWIQLATPQLVSNTTGSAGIMPVFTGLSLVMPSNAIFRFAIQVDENGPYYGGSGSTPNLFSNGGVDILAQNHPLSASYAGGTGGPTNTPRSFYGSITFSVNAGPACSGNPVAGATVIVPGYNCANFSTSLALSGNTSGGGQTYQWQSSPDNTPGSYTNFGVAGGNSGAGVTPVSTTWYRAVVTCGSNSDTSTPVQVHITPQLSGTYSINAANPTDITSGGSNFASFTDAANALYCGITGPVTFNVAAGSGPYTEQVSFPIIPGASATNTITINGNGNTLQATPVTANRYVLQLNGADRVSVNNLTIKSLDLGFGWGVHLMNGADNNSFNNCNIEIASTNTSQSNSGGIVASNSLTAVTSAGNNCNNLSITNCTITGGYQGIIINGNTNGTSAIATISNNIIKDFYANGIEVTNCNGGTISGNDINRMTRVAVTTFAGIEVGAGCRNLTVNANKIHDTHNAATTQSGTAYGIYSNASDAPSTEENIFSNNLIYNFNSTTGTQYGIYNLNSNGAYYFHNTIVLNHQGSSSGVTRGFNQSGDANNIFVKNNIFYLNRSGTGIKYGLYLNTATSVVTADFNDYYNNSLLGTNGIAFLGSGYNNLAAWQASNGQAYDQNSVSMDPQFVSLAGANFIPANPLLDNLGTPITAVITDYSGATRSTTTPDIGAFEFSTGACTGTPVAGTATISVIGTQCPNTSVTFSLNGSSLGTGLTYQWQTSATNAPGSYTNAGTSSTNMAYTATLPITAWYRAVVTCNGLGDTSAPVVVNVYPGFSGTFTIDGGAPTGNGNFQSFADAVSAMACGIVGPVVFNVVAGSGPYNEQVVIPQISGTSATNTVTINGNGETIEFASTTSASRSGIYLNGADFVTINELNIDGTAGTYGWGVHFMNSADNNTITGCNIRVSNINDATNAHCPIVMNNSTSVLLTGGSSGTGNTVTGCTLIGGYYNVVLAGASASNITTNNTLTNNIIRDAYSYSVYVEFHSNALIKGNDISRPARATSTNSAGVYLSSGLGITVQDNKIHNMFDAMPTNTSIFYGVGGLADGTAASPNKLINNLIYNIAGQGTHYGIFSSTAPYMEAYHNTISFDNTAATAGITYGIYQTGTALGNIFRNNIIYITRGGSGVKYGIYKNTAGNAIVSNNNVFYVNSAGSGVQGIGYQTSAQTTLANWQAASGNDANSIVVDPNFTDPGAGDFTPTVVQTNNMGANVGVLTDIFGNPRSTTTPDPGAIEFNVVACVAPPTSGTVTQSVMSLCSGQNVTLGLNGNSTGAGQTYQWESSTSALPGSWTAIGTPSITTSLTTAVATNTYFRAAVTCSGNTVYTPEILVAVNDPFAGGFYTINSTLPTDIGSGGVNFQSFNDAVLAISCGITGPVVFDVTPGTGPYVEQVVFPATITGTSAANTITFNGNGNTIRFASTDANRRAVIRLDGTDHVTFNDLVVEAIGSTSTEYAWGIHLFGDADFNTINNCTINAGTAGITTANFAGIVINGSLTAPTTGGTGNGNVVSNNTIIGGYYGILCSGTSGSVNAGNIITDNNVREFYTYGIYTTYNNGILIEDNNIQRPTRLNVSTFYGVALSTGSVGAQVNRNIIHNPFGGEPTATSATYGLYVAADATAANPNKLTNNLIYNINGNGINYLLHNAGGDHAWYYHNTVSSELATSTATGATYGFYQTTSATGVEVRNNIISIKRGGTGAKYGIYMNTPASAVNSDNNVLFLDAQNANVGYKNSIAYLTLPLWQAAGSDLSSFDVDPGFTSPATGDFTPTTGTFDNQGVPLGVVSDILGTPRSATPDIGAYEFSALLCAGTPLNPGTVTGPTTAICNGNPAQLEIADYPTDAGITLQWEYYDVAGSSWQPVALATDPVLSLTGMTNTTDYRVAVTCTSAGGGTAYSNIVTVTVVNPQITGTTPVSNCGAGSVTLGASATPGAVINWYDSPTSITPLATGPNFVTPIIGSTTTYFASAGNGGYTVFTGRTAPNPGTAASTANYGQVFTVTTPMILNSVEVRSTTGTSMTVSLYNGGGTSQLQTTGANTVPTNSTNTIALGWSLAPGTYRLVANAITGSFLRESSGITYPIALATAGQITAYHTSLTGAPNTGAAYNYFYNWNITVGCESPRTPVTATIAPSVAITATGSDDTVCMGTPVQLSASSSNANYSYTWTPGGSGATVSVTPAATTTYYVNAFDNGSNCTAVDSFKVTVKSVDPAIATVANPEEICVTGQVTVSLDPAPAFGITYQWQADNGSGFSDIPGAVAPTYVTTLSNSATFQAKLYCDGNLVATSAPVNVPVANPAIVNTFPGSRCTPGQVVLAAEANTQTSTIQWFTSATGGAPLGTGGAFITPSISANTTYYVSATDGGAVINAGRATPFPTSTGFTGNNYGMVFDATSSFVLQSVDIYPTGAAGSVSVQLLNSAGTVLQTAGPFSFPAGTGTTFGSGATPHTINLNFNVPAGMGYELNTIGQTAPLVRDNPIGSNFTYPLPIGSAGNIVAGLLSGAPNPNTYYYYYNWRVATGCESPRVPVLASIEPTSTGTGLARGGTVVGNNQADGTTVGYDDPCGEKVATITDAASGNVLGNTSAIVITPATVQTFGGQPYVSRVYDITPATDGPATVTLYALQSEFNAFNNYVTANNLPYPLLPVNGTDLAGISNIAVTQYHGSALAGKTGPINLYDITQQELIPNSAISASFNGQYWSLTFPVTGFSGFFIHTGNAPLAVTMKSITAGNYGQRNRVDWTTEEEKGAESFIVEQSANATDFQQIGKLAANGKASSYSFWDESPVAGMNYYRLKIMAKDGSSRYSSTVKAYVQAEGSFSLEAFPNPARDVITIRTYGTQGSNPAVFITDVSGKIVLSAKLTGVETIIDVQALAQGMYLIKYNDDQRSEVIRISKD